MHTNKNVLTAQVTTIVEYNGIGSDREKVLRPFISDRCTGAILETMVVFIDSNFGKNPPNTQIAILRDLAFFYEWELFKAERDTDWVAPEVRISQSLCPLSSREIQDFARWCQWGSRTLVAARQELSAGGNVRTFPTGRGVDSSTSNRKLEYAREYLIWLIESLIPECLDHTKSRHESGSVIIRKLRKEFSKHIKGEAKYLPPASLKREAREQLRSLIGARSNTSFELRDQLIIGLLLEGIRVGELLKIRTFDVSERTEIDSGVYCATVMIQRRPNDPDDQRTREPAVKTLSGLLPIDTKLAQALINYIINERSEVIEKTNSRALHSLLFVSHEGPTIGRPLSQRSINRIVAKYKGIGEIPDSLAPHVLRHTHMTEVEEVLAKKGASEATRRGTLTNRGRWSRNSTMPSHYTSREQLRQSAAAVARRDQIIYGKE